MDDDAKRALVADVERKANDLAAALGVATDAGIGPAVLLPVLVTVFRSSGLPIPGNAASLAKAAGVTVDGAELTAAG